jgi:LPXTG-motif cell wall-anchored protein
MGNYSQISKGQWDSMAFRITSYIVNREYLIAPICMIGIVAVAYGMVKDNNLIFIIGLLFVIGGYLLIRRKTKESIRNNP